MVPPLWPVQDSHHYDINSFPSSCLPSLPWVGSWEGVERLIRKCLIICFQFLKTHSRHLGEEAKYESYSRLAWLCG